MKREKERQGYMTMLGQTLFGRKPDGRKLSDASLLDRCLQALDRGEDLRRILQRYPERAGRLRPLLEMVSQVQEHYAQVPEPPGGLVAGRARMVHAATQAAADADQAAADADQVKARSDILRKPARRAPWRLNLTPVWRWVGAALLVLLALVPLAPHIAHAASQSVPGGPLYGIKLTSENFHFASVADPELRVVLSLALMDERVEELKALAVKRKPIPAVVLSRMTELSEQALDAAAATSDSAMPGSLEFIAHRTEMQADVLVDLMAYAKATQHGSLLQAQATCWRTHQVAVMALNAPQAFQQMYQGEDIDKDLALPVVGAPEALDGPAETGSP
jgi:hypothetical protein